MREGWTYKKFEDCLVKAPKAKQVQTSEYNAGSKYPIISQEDKMISGYCDDSSLLYHIDCPIVIFGDHTRVLKYVDFDFVVGADGVKILIPKDFLRAKYLFYYLQWYKIPSLGYSRHYKLLKEINIPVPPLSEQQRIVSELDLLSSIIEKKKAQLKEYDQLTQSIFYDMFGDPSTNEKGWDVKKLGDVGIIVAGSTPSTNDESNWDGHVNWVTPAELGEQLYYGETARKLTDKGAKGLTMMPVGTVLLSSRAPIGKLAITTVPMCCNQGFKNIICNNTINNVFLYYYLKNTMDLVQALGRGATFKEVSKSAISSYKIILPPLSLQQSFAEKIETIEHQKALIQQSIAETETLFNSRMDYYFN
ncbi:MAG: restriction endonuclease subunit S [Prevotella sp.]|nr:restriction endonuclease subunit S [Prevotella sp.]